MDFSHPYFPFNNKIGSLTSPFLSFSPCHSRCIFDYSLLGLVSVHNYIVPRTSFRLAMAVARLAAAVAIKQEPPDSPPATTGSCPGSISTFGAAEGHTHPLESRPVHPVELDERILNLCSQNPKGITDDIIMADQPQINTEQRMNALQRLLSQV